MYSLAVPMKYFLKVNSHQSSGWFDSNMYKINSNFCLITFYHLQYNDKLLSHKLSQIYKQYPLPMISLIVVLYETRYDKY